MIAVVRGTAGGGLGTGLRLSGRGGGRGDTRWAMPVVIVRSTLLACVVMMVVMVVVVVSMAGGGFGTGLRLSRRCGRLGNARRTMPVVIVRHA